MNGQETNHIYNLYAKKPTEYTVEDETKAVLNGIIPHIKKFNINQNGIRAYLASQGIMDMESIRYVQSKLK